MHYHEVLADGTCVGLFDGTRPKGAISTDRFWQYFDEVAQREHPTTRGYVFVERRGERTRAAIAHAKIRTALISTYRVHSRRFFAGGERFPESWAPSNLKRETPERYSPKGTTGYYLGLSVDAALDEAHRYDPTIDATKDGSKILLVHRTYYHDILYLTPVLPSLWEHLSLPKMHTWDMYLTVMNPLTTNDVTDQIGQWAREEGFKGILYPSARYGQRLHTTEDARRQAFPALNFIEVGSHLCHQGVAMQLTLNALADTLVRVKSNELPPIVYSEPNLVVFDEGAVTGRDRPVFYATYELHQSHQVKAADERQGLKNQIELSCDESGIFLSVDHPEYTFRVQAPRAVDPGEPAVFSVHHSKVQTRWMELTRDDVLWGPLTGAEGGVSRRATRGDRTGRGNRRPSEARGCWP